MFPEIRTALQQHFQQFPTTPETEEFYRNLLVDLNDTVADKISQGLDRPTAIKETLANLPDLDEILQTVTASESGSLDHRRLARLYDHFLALKLVNTSKFSCQHLNQIIITYRQAKISLLPGAAGTELLVNEYCNLARPNTYLTGKNEGDKLKLTQPERVPLAFLRIHVEIIVPADFTGFIYLSNKIGALHLVDLTGHYILEATTASGAIRARNLQLAQIHLQTKSGQITGRQLQSPQLALISTSGRIQINDARGSGPESMISVMAKSGTLNCRRLQAAEINLECTSGSIGAVELTAKRFHFYARSGEINGQRLTGCGHFENTSGNLELGFDQVSGDLNCLNKSGLLKLKLPEKSSYYFQLTNRAGQLVLPENAVYQTPRTRHQQHGQLGPTPTFKVSARTSSGLIEVK
ncbi:DUF4097 domain-containing protein [Lapidilactobacillus luobeiensis]|uniref:DUF4097 domain-containing protein n=1 Tax=Lapidilactobacillus luobeiensis TaxID=2950371 RepID=UPI0021C44D9F|nr:DUF4097 domain-containing protein [Lapidilactobacillus luobeiensis]